MSENNLSRESLLFRVNNVDKTFYINKYYLAVTMEIPLYRDKYVFKLYNAFLWVVIVLYPWPFYRAYNLDTFELFIRSAIKVRKIITMFNR